MKRAVIFSNGNLSDYSEVGRIIKKGDYIICADGGADTALKLGIKPDVIIGDFDSFNPLKSCKGSPCEAKLIKYPRKKDKTDFELAVDLTVEKKVSEIIIVGLLGDRLDHLISSLMLLARLKQMYFSPDIKIIEGNTIAYIVNKQIILTGKINDELSIVPLTGDLKIIETNGLEYKPDGSVLTFGSTRGVSNVFCKNRVSVKIEKGIAMIVHLSIIIRA